MRVSNWLWEVEQKDIEKLQRIYKDLDYDLTKEQCYEIWFTYSEVCAANWLTVDNDIYEDIQNTITWGIVDRFSKELETVYDVVHKINAKFVYIKTLEGDNFILSSKTAIHQFGDREAIKVNIEKEHCEIIIK